MKKIHFIALLMIAVSAVIIITASGDVSTYATFDVAKDGQRVKIVGELAKDRDMVYNPNENADVFSFFLTDEDGNTKQVKLLQAKPQDFERAESIVLTGQMKGDYFEADEILMKCPSKYKDEEINLKSKVG